MINVILNAVQAILDVVLIVLIVKMIKAKREDES